ncbi:MAG: glycine zipper 2TM domain-containing protein [Rhodoferax sp.]|nr:glycine zipper 2TM domain-containing protein [Rhodoferax sp.]
MKRIVITSLFASALLGAQAQTFTDSARVRSAEPQYENVSVPRNECSSHWVNEPDRRISADPQRNQDRQYGGAIVGGLAGGVLGHQVGGGSGKDAATALGVVLGAMAGDQLQNRDAQRQYDNRQYDNGQYNNGGYETAQREVKRCRTVYDAQTRITGYRVSYDYRGQNYTTFMRTNPGNSLPVRVTVEPVTQ